jgi:hypothetical protein
MLGNHTDQPLVDLPNVPIGWNGVDTGTYIVKFALWDAAFLDQLITNTIYVVAVVHISQVKDMFQALMAKGIHDNAAVVLGLPGNIVDQGTEIKQVIVFLGFPSSHGTASSAVR